MQFSGGKKGRQTKLPAAPEQIGKDWPVKWPGSGHNAAGFVQKLSACRPEGCFRAAAATEKQLFRQQNRLSGVLWGADWECAPQKVLRRKRLWNCFHFLVAAQCAAEATGHCRRRQACPLNRCGFCRSCRICKSVHAGTLQLEKKAVYYKEKNPMIHSGFRSKRDNKIGVGLTAG